MDDAFAYETVLEISQMLSIGTKIDKCQSLSQQYCSLDLEYSEMRIS